MLCTAHRKWVHRRQAEAQTALPSWPQPLGACSCSHGPADSLLCCFSCCRFSCCCWLWLLLGVACPASHGFDRLKGAPVDGAGSMLCNGRLVGWHLHHHRTTQGHPLFSLLFGQGRCCCIATHDTVHASPGCGQVHLEHTRPCTCDSTIDTTQTDDASHIGMASAAALGGCSIQDCSCSGGQLHGLQHSASGMHLVRRPGYAPAIIAIIIYTILLKRVKRV